VVGGVGQVSVCLFGARAPVPGVLEGEELGIGRVAGLVFEDDVVVAVRVERGVEVDQVDAGVGQVAAQDVEVVAVGEDVGASSIIGPPAWACG